MIRGYWYALLCTALGCVVSCSQRDTAATAAPPVRIASSPAAPLLTADGVHAEKTCSGEILQEKVRRYPFVEKELRGLEVGDWEGHQPTSVLSVKLVDGVAVEPLIQRHRAVEANALGEGGFEFHFSSATHAMAAQRALLCDKDVEWVTMSVLWTAKQVNGDGEGHKTRPPHHD